MIHTSEILFAFNQPALGGLLPITDAQKAVGRRVSGSWANFAWNRGPSKSGGGDDSLADWPVAYTKAQAAMTGRGVREASVRVIGGPGAGLQTLSLDAKGGVESPLLRRCLFINSEDVQRQLQT